jgi:hypothetical protein
MPIPAAFGIFPNLARSQARLTSPFAPNYNCIAWAAGETSRWWWPSKGGCYWPQDARADSSLEAFIEAFQTLGYETCEGADPEQDYEKVAIYTYQSQVKHMARQLPNGRWTSKLGQAQDIEHELDDLTSNHSNGYGEVEQFMRRLIQ